jgi:hypothetical protein
MRENGCSADKPSPSPLFGESPMLATTPVRSVAATDVDQRPTVVQPTPAVPAVAGSGREDLNCSWVVDPTGMLRLQWGVRARR